MSKYWIEVDERSYVSVGGSVIRLKSASTPGFHKFYLDDKEVCLIGSFDEAQAKAKEYMDAVEAWHSTLTIDPDGKVSKLNEIVYRLSDVGKGQNPVDYNGEGKEINNGWTNNTGKKPVEDNVRVEFEYRNGIRQTADAGNLRWPITGTYGDIIRWRLAK